MQKFLFLGIVVMIILTGIVGVCCAQRNTETMSITTYYPSPHGVYKTLRLSPSTSPKVGDGCSNRMGEMAYDRSWGHNYPIYCDGTQWRATGAAIAPDIRRGTLMSSFGDSFACLPEQGLGVAPFPESISFNPPFAPGVIPAVMLTVIEPDDCGATACRVIDVDNVHFTFKCWIGVSIPYAAQGVHWVAIAPKQ